MPSGAARGANATVCAVEPLCCDRCLLKAHGLKPRTVCEAGVGMVRPAPGYCLAAWSVVGKGEHAVALHRPVAAQLVSEGAGTRLLLSGIRSSDLRVRRGVPGIWAPRGD